jgi:hypothetical protein
MEAAKYNQPESVQLALAAGAAVNAASLPPGSVPDNGYNDGYPYPCGGVYEIKRGRRGDSDGPGARHRRAPAARSQKALIFIKKMARPKRFELLTLRFVV